MPYQVIKENGEVESPSKTRRQMVKDLKGMPQGQTVLGVIGEPKEEKETVPVLTDDEINERTGIQNLLTRYIQPPSLGSKFTTRQAEMRFAKKVNNMSLNTLRKLWGKPIPEDGILSTDEQVEMQRNWEDISP